MNTEKMQKIGYGLGDIGSNFSWTFISSLYNALLHKY